MNDKKRDIFHWEHVFPVSDLINECLESNGPDTRTIMNTILKVRIAWILKSEDRKLKKFARGADPLKSYHEAGIELIGI